MREKKFFDSYVEHRSPVQTDAADGAPGAPVEVAAPRAGARALPRRSETAIALYHEGAPAASEWGDELDTSARPDPSDPLRRLFDLLWRRRFIVLPVVLGALLLGLLYSVRARRVYSATATLLVNTSPLASEKRPDSSSASPDAPPTDVPGVDEARRLETQLEIVKTDGVLQAAIQKLDAPQKDAIERFYSLNVGSVRNTDLVTVTVGSPDAGASAALANAICNSYIDRSQKNNRRAIEAAADSARGQLETVRANLNKARDALKNYQGQVGISDGAEQAKNVAQTLETTKADLTQARAAQAAAAATLKVQQDVLANTAREIVSYTTVTRPTVIALRAELTKLRLDRIAARAEYAETSDIVRQLDGQIARVQAQLGREPENETTPAQRAPNPALHHGGAKRGQRARRFAGSARAHSDFGKQPAAHPNRAGAVARQNRATDATRQQFSGAANDLRFAGPKSANAATERRFAAFQRFAQFAPPRRRARRRDADATRFC